MTDKQPTTACGKEKAMTANTTHWTNIQFAAFVATLIAAYIGIIALILTVHQWVHHG